MALLHTFYVFPSYSAVDHCVRSLSKLLVSPKGTYKGLYSSGMLILLIYIIHYNKMYINTYLNTFLCITILQHIIWYLSSLKTIQYILCSLYRDQHLDMLVQTHMVPCSPAMGEEHLPKSFFQPTLIFMLIWVSKILEKVAALVNRESL